MSLSYGCGYYSRSMKDSLNFVAKKIKIVYAKNKPLDCDAGKYYKDFISKYEGLADETKNLYTELTFENDFTTFCEKYNEILEQKLYAYVKFTLKDEFKCEFNEFCCPLDELKCELPSLGSILHIDSKLNFSFSDNWAIGVDISTVVEFEKVKSLYFDTEMGKYMFKTTKDDDLEHGDSYNSVHLVDLEYIPTMVELIKSTGLKGNFSLNFDD